MFFLSGWERKRMATKMVAPKSCGHFFELSLPAGKYAKPF